MKTEALRHCIQAQYGKVDYEAARKEMTDIEYTIDEQAATIARLTAAHEMQGESLVVLPRWMVENMADRTEAINSAIEDIKYYVANPSAWEHYDDGVSEKIRAILKAAGMA